MATRRQFIAQTAGVVAAIGCGAASTKPVAAANVSQQANWQIAIFEKPFEGLNYEQLADAMDQIGADGVEATIRGNGHIKPEAAADEVPKMVKAMTNRGKRIVIAATDVRAVEGEQTEKFLRTLKNNGVNHYRLGHFYLELDKPLDPQIENYAAQARDLAALNKQIGIQGLYQNHSGANRGRGYVGALGWDAARMLNGIDPTALGIALDTRHLKKDTGSSWQIAVAACKPHIRSIYVKDGLWHGPRGDQYKDVPLDTGFVNRKVFDHMRADLDPMPMSIHMEWLGYRVFPKDEIPEAIAACRRDLQTLKGWIE